MKNIRNLYKSTFFEGERYTVIKNTTTTILESIIIAIFIYNLYVQYSISKANFNLNEILKLILTPWIIIFVVLLVVYYFVVKKQIYFTIEGKKTFEELLAKYWFVFTHRNNIKKNKKNNSHIKLKTI